MTNEHDKALDLELEAFFDAARDIPDDPSPDLLARVLADAYSEQDAASVVVEAAPTQAKTRRRGMLGGLLDGLGGWPVLAGLATATVAGVWIGYNPPAAFDALSLQLIDSAYGVTMDSSLPDYDGFWVDS